MRKPYIEELQSIYAALDDDMSRSIYRHRLLYSLFGDKTTIKEMIYELFPDTKQIETSKVCYYGAGGGGISFIQVKRDIPFIIDQYQEGSLCGIPIISLDDFVKRPDCEQFLVIVTIAREDIRREVENELVRRGLRYILGCPGLQYFDLNALDLQDEYFVDAGALDGNTTKSFFDQVKNGRSYVFEPNPRQFEITKKRFCTCPQVELFPYGLSDRNNKVRFDPMDMNAGSARCSESGSIQVQVRRLDSLLSDRKVTYIKMDIEGSELAALRGAERIIREKRPKLAISVYHKPEDIWEIPRLILSYHPDYKLYLRHYSIMDTETVLYAV